MAEQSKEMNRIESHNPYEKRVSEIINVEQMKIKTNLIWYKMQRTRQYYTTTTKTKVKLMNRITNERMGKKAHGKANKCYMQTSTNGMTWIVCLA